MDKFSSVKVVERATGTVVDSLRGNGNLVEMEKILDEKWVKSWADIEKYEIISNTGVCVYSLSHHHIQK